MNPTAPRWQDLLTSYLHKQQDAQEIPTSEVEPYQAQPALGLDAALAWPDALLPGAMLDSDLNEAKLPVAWAQQVRYMAWSAPFPCCVGLAPQFLQQIAPLMESAQTFFQRLIQIPSSTNGLSDANSPMAQRLATARVHGDAQQVQVLLRDLQPGTLKDNELAAQAWLQDNRSKAQTIWIRLDSKNPVIAFNQALAALATGDVAKGRSHLNAAKAGFPESSGWHHLAELYLVSLG